MSLLLCLGAAPALARQDEGRPVLKAGALPEEFRLDGVLDEPAWAQADAIRGLTMIEPEEGVAPTERTEVRVLADRSAIVIAIRCHDSDPAGIVSRTFDRDASLEGQDHVRLVLDPFQDGRSGYVFAVNPGGARVDALVARRGEGEDRNWDGIWEAKTSIDEGGWSVEIRIPILTLSFREGLRAWNFNVERRVERRRETSRWASPKRDYELTQSSRAGLLADLPEFSHGAGTSVRPAAVATYGRATPAAKTDFDAEASLDVTQRLAPSLLAQLTINTDFSETEVDARRSNLTRFPLFFPEKRTFFLEGSEVFDFGLGLMQDVIPFHSRTIGLVGGKEVPLLVGGKINGLVDETNVGALAAHTGAEPGVAPEASMGVVRVKQNILEESSAGIIATAGDPLDRDQAWLAGADVTYQTSRLWGDKNFLVGAWGLASGREDRPGAAAFGGKIDYPNDDLDVMVTWKRIGADFDPSLGFVPRRGIHKYDAGAEISWRPESDIVRKVSWDATPQLVTDLEGHWESYRLHVEAVNVEFETGDAAEFHVSWQGDRPPVDFEVADNVLIPAGDHHWTRYHAAVETAARRPVSAEADLHFGDFYEGRLTEIELSVNVNPIPLFTLSAFAERNTGHLDGGSFREDLYAGRLRLNLSPDFNVSTFVQFDTESRLLGSFSRLRWTVTPLSEVFLVFTYNWAERQGDLRPETFETAVKVQYTLRF